MPLFPRNEEFIVANNPLKTHLDIANQGIKDEDMLRVISLLEEKNGYITSIDASHNSISDVGAKALAAFIIKRKEQSEEKNSERKPRAINKINLDKNALIESDGGIALIRSAVPKLILSRTSIADDVAEVAINEATQSELDLGRFISSALTKKVAKKIEQNNMELTKSADAKTIGPFFSKTNTPRTSSTLSQTQSDSNPATPSSTPSSGEGEKTPGTHTPRKLTD